MGYGAYYECTDRQPASKNYYRLKMVDLDGSFKYSEVIILENYDIENKLIDLFPNPIIDMLGLQLNEDLNFPVKLIIYNNIGKLVLEKEDVFGDNKTYFQEDLSFLSSGTYSIVIENTTFAFKYINTLIKE